MNRIIAIILAALLVLSCLAFVGCGEETPDKPDDGKKEQEDDKKDDEKNNPYSEGGEELELEDLIDTTATLDLPEGLKYENYICRIFAPEPYGPTTFYREELNDTPVNDATYNRNLKMQDNLGVTVEAVSLDTNAGNQAEKFIDDVLSGNHSFDFAAVHTISSCAALIMSNALLPFESLEYVDFEKPWWNTGINETCSVMGENYFALSPMCSGYYNNTSCILFNKDLATEHNLPNLYDLVRNDQWTIDKLIDLTKNFSQDLDGDGIFTDKDQVAIISDDAAYMNFWLGAFRQSTVEKGENDQPYIVANSARMENALSKVSELFNTGRRGIIYDMDDRCDGDDEWKTAFAEGRVLFDVVHMGTAVGLRDYDINFGILPMPKLNNEQERYGSWVDPWGMLLCVPSDCEDPERTGAILEAMSYYSYQLVYPAVLEQSIYGTATRDTESIEMLKIIYDNMFFDFGFIFDSTSKGYGRIFADLVPGGNIDIASYIAEKRNTAESHFADLYDAMVQNFG